MGRSRLTIELLVKALCILCMLILGCSFWGSSATADTLPWRPIEVPAHAKAVPAPPFAPRLMPHNARSMASASSSFARVARHVAKNQRALRAAFSSLIDISPEASLQDLSPATTLQPLRLTIPTLDVDAEIEPVGQDETGAMDVPTRVEDVAWYTGAAAPGDVGNAVIAGHLDDIYGKPAVFAQIDQLVPGDPVIVTGVDGTKLLFVGARPGHL